MQRLCYLPGSVQWIDITCLPVNYPLKKLSASCPSIYMIWECAFMMQFLYHMWFPTIYVKVHEKYK